MPIESHLNKEDINIQHLSLEEPERTEKLPFDADKEITADDWANMKEALVISRINTSRDDFVRIAKYMKLLFPERVSELALDNNDWGAIKLDIDNYRPRSDNDKFFLIASAAKILFPERIKELGLDDQDWEMIKWKMQNSYATRQWDKLLTEAEYAKLLFPRHEFGALLKDERTWEGIKKHIEGLKNEKSNMVLFVGYASTAKLLFPSHAGEINFDKNTWDVVKKNLNFYREIHASSTLAVYAAAMKIMAAEDAEITDEGIFEINMRKLKINLPEQKPVPETKKF